MNTNKKLIIAFIVIVFVVLAGVIAFAPQPSKEAPVKPNLTLANKNFGYFEMEVPEGSNFQIKNNQIEVGKGKVMWQNKGNFSNETDVIAISKGYTDSLIPEYMELSSQDGDLKIYISSNTINKLYKVVRSIGDVDIIVSGYNLTLIEKMANSTTLKDTSKLVLEKPVNNTLNKTKNVETTKDKTSNADKKSKVETTTEKTKSNVETTTDKSKSNVETTSEKTKSKSSNVETTSERVPNKGGDIFIGGGSFTTGSELEDKTYAKLYLGKEHAGESVKIRILYSRDGVSLNHGNLVDATIKGDGYVSIASADAYSKYPDYASVEVYDSSGQLVSTQGISLDTISGTQYF